MYYVIGMYDLFLKGQEIANTRTESAGAFLSEDIIFLSDHIQLLNTYFVAIVLLMVDA